MKNIKKFCFLLKQHKINTRNYKKKYFKINKNLSKKNKLKKLINNNNQQIFKKTI